ncbi:MAG: hypothetical protein HZC26_04000 [Candidatus Magasanikbacteria bacterium]|nr:hypothetical protein [Candidatus Magasanikbacteria bacterium]
MIKEKEIKKIDDAPVKEIESGESGDTLKELIEKNIKWSQVIYEQNRKIKRRLTWMVVGGYLRLMIVVVPLILAFIYLPPLIRDLFGQYAGIINGLQGATKGGQLDVNSIINQISPSQMQSIINLLGR